MPIAALLCFRRDVYLPPTSHRKTVPLWASAVESCVAETLWERRRPYWKNYYQNTDAIIYMVDSADKRRNDEAAEELESLMSEELLATCPVLVFANKQDLINAQTSSEVMEYLELTAEKSRWVHVAGCSAKTGDGLEDGLGKLLAQLQSKA